MNPLSATGLSYGVTQKCYVFGLQSRLSKILAKTAAALVQPTPEKLSQKRRIISFLAKKSQPTYHRWITTNGLCVSWLYNRNKSMSSYCTIARACPEWDSKPRQETQAFTKYAIWEKEAGSDWLNFKPYFSIFLPPLRRFQMSHYCKVHILLFCIK